jgi:putative ABC transport system ATP-binding protein
MFEFIEVKYKDIINIPNLSINKGITTLVGASGSGKTTILKMLNKMISPTQGRILFYGQDIQQLHTVSHRRKVIMLSQSPAMFASTIRDNFITALRYHEKEIPDDADLYLILKQIQLNKELETPVINLSGGEKQRLALGRVILLNPDVFLLDEPSSALDDDTEKMIIEMLARHAKEFNKDIVMVTHSKTIAERYADEILEIANGKVVNRRLNNEWDN